MFFFFSVGLAAIKRSTELLCNGKRVLSTNRFHVWQTKACALSRFDCKHSRWKINGADKLTKQITPMSSSLHRDCKDAKQKFTSRIKPTQAECMLSVSGNFIDFSSKWTWLQVFRFKFKNEQKRRFFMRTYSTSFNFNFNFIWTHSIRMMFKCRIQ